MDSIHELLQCSICLESYIQPRALPCLHTFCEICLQQYINATARNASLKYGFECPLCRAHTLPSKSAKSCHSEWSKLFPVNHIVVSLSEARNNETSQTDKLNNKNVNDSTSNTDDSLKVDNANTTETNTTCSDGVEVSTSLSDKPNCSSSEHTPGYLSFRSETTPRSSSLVNKSNSSEETTLKAQKGNGTKGHNQYKRGQSTYSHTNFHESHSPLLSQYRDVPTDDPYLCSQPTESSIDGPSPHLIRNTSHERYDGPPPQVFRSTSYEHQDGPPPHVFRSTSHGHQAEPPPSVFRSTSLDHQDRPPPNLYNQQPEIPDVGPPSYFHGPPHGPPPHHGHSHGPRHCPPRGHHHFPPHRPRHPPPHGPWHLPPHDFDHCPPHGPRHGPRHFPPPGSHHGPHHGPPHGPHHGPRRGFH